MADMPIKHKAFSAQEILLHSEHRPFFEGPEEMAEWPGDFDPLFERGIHKGQAGVFCTSPFSDGTQERVGLETEGSGYYISKLTQWNELRIQPHFWSDTLWGMSIATPYLSEMDGQLNKCYFGDMDGDGMDDIAYQTKITGGGAAVYHNYVFLQSSWRKFLPNGAALPETYENLLEKSRQFCNFIIGAKSFNRIAPPEVVKAIALFIGSMAALNLSKEEENLIVTDAASILHHLSFHTADYKSQGSSDEQLTGEVLQVMHTLRVIFERVARYERAEELTELIHEIVELSTLRNKNDDSYQLKDSEIITPLLKFTEYIDDAGQLKRALTMLKFALSSKNLSRRDHIFAVHSIYRLAKNLSKVEFSLIYGEMRKKFNRVYTIESSELIGGLEKIVFNDPPEAYFAKAYEWLADEDPGELNRELLTKYGFASDAVFPPPYKDILYADEHLGPEKARLLYEKFNIVHFKRYSPSILNHLVEMAKETGHKRDKPLVLALVAKSDPQGMFYWGKNFDYNEDTRVIVVEVGSKNEFLYYNRWVKENYGTPNAIFITAHGKPYEILLGESEFSYEDTMGMRDDEMLKQELDKIYGQERPKLVVINACSAGVPDPPTGNSFAQTIADVYQAPTLAARAKEALPRLDVDVVDGNVILYPYFIEYGERFWNVSFNFGGTLFTPGQINARSRTKHSPR